ncbi:transposase [Cutibacterium equinum]|uniref:Transposase n=1 Tax=Cutibacterium equinum TaxID=3016342 RepID=A0ABY7R032_9ACTN|nr:transposase [Cutibacterium equinum]WCC80663.1 transposase [Cutibacterium equinum]
MSRSWGEVTAWVTALPGLAAVILEAGPTGYGLARTLLWYGIRTVVAAPSKLQRPSGARVKTDAIDAEHLSTLLRLDGFTAVTVPDEFTEAARGLVRAREDCRSDLMRACHRGSKLLARHGVVYSGG